MEAPSPPGRVFELLHREDEYYLGGGDGVISVDPPVRTSVALPPADSPG
jgi:hypothetical protein